MGAGEDAAGRGRMQARAGAEDRDATQDDQRRGGGAGRLDADGLELLEPAEALEARPSGDFVDGYLAGFASLNTALEGADPGGGWDAQFYFSFDWVGDVDEDREDALDALFGADPGVAAPAIRVEPIVEWRREIARLGGRWLARRLRDDSEPSALPRALAREFLELMEAHLGGAPIAAFRVQISGDAPGAQDRMLLETEEGRFLLEFVVESARADEAPGGDVGSQGAPPRSLSREPRPGAAPRDAA